MTDDDDDVFPDDWGCEAAADDEAPIAVEEDLDVVEEEDPPAEDTAENPDEMEAQDEEMPAEDPEGDLLAQDAPEPLTGEIVLDDDGDDEEDDDDLAAAEAAVAALDSAEDESPAPVTVAKAPVAKAPVAKAPIAKAPIGKAPVGKAPIGKAPSGTLSGPGKVASEKGLGKVSANAPPWQKGSKQITIPKIASSYENKGPSGKGAFSGAKGLAKGGIGKDSSKNHGKVPVQSVAQSGTAAKAKGKGAPKDGGVGHRVLALNKKGHWQTGRGISVQALEALRKLSPTAALEILADLEKKAASVQNPTKYLIEKANGGTQATEGKASNGKGKKGPADSAKATNAPPWRSGPATVAPDKGIKRPVPTEPAAPPPKKVAVQTADDAGVDELLEQLEPAVFKKVQEVRKAHEFSAEALTALGAAEEKDAMVLLQAFLSRVAAGKAPDLTRFIVKSLEARKKGAGIVAKPAGAKAGVAKAPITKAPVGKAPVGKAPLVKAPVGQAPVAKAPVAKAARVPTQGIGKPPVARTDLEFDQMAVQGKLQALNKLGLWEGTHPLDEAALGALLAIDPGRALEILDEAEEKASDLKNPSEFVRTTIRDDPR